MSTSGLWEPVSPSADYVAVTPTGGISATNLQDALTELDTEKVALDSQLIYDLEFVLALQMGAIM